MPSNFKRYTNNPRQVSAEEERIVFAFVVQYTARNLGHLPTLSEIYKQCALTSLSAAHAIVHSLIDSGKLRLLDNGYIVIPGSQFIWQPDPDETLRDSHTIPAQHWAVDYETDGEAGIRDCGRDRSLVPGS